MNQEKQKVKVYRAEFRESSVELTIDSALPIARTAKDIGINPNTLHTWINKYSQLKKQAKTVRTDDLLYEELKQLKKENARLIEERDPLNKAAAYPSTNSGRLCQGTTVKYAWIKQQVTEFSVKTMCRFMGVSRSA